MAGGVWEEAELGNGFAGTGDDNAFAFLGARDKLR